MKDEKTRQADWMSLLLSAQIGSPVTPAQLLGTEKEQQKERLGHAAKELRKLERDMKKAGMTT